MIKIKSFFRRIYFKVFPQNIAHKLEKQHKLEFAFVDDQGLKVYRFKDPLELGYERALFAHAAFREFEARVDKQYLVQFCAKVEELISSGHFAEIAVINNHLKERVNYVIDPDLAWKLFVIQYFDEGENPYKVDQKRMKERIARYKKSEEITAFFLQMHIGELCPYLKESESDIPSYLMVLEKIKEQHLQALTLKTSKPSSTKKQQSSSPSPAGFQVK